MNKTEILFTIWGCVYLVGGFATGAALGADWVVSGKRYHRWGSWTIPVRAVLWPFVVLHAFVSDWMDR